MFCIVGIDRVCAALVFQQDFVNVNRLVKFCWETRYGAIHVEAVAVSSESKVRFKLVSMLHDKRPVKLNFEFVPHEGHDRIGRTNVHAVRCIPVVHFTPCRICKCLFSDFIWNI